MDKKGRLTVPLQVREQLGIEPGDVFFLEGREDALYFAKAVNPFDGLAADAIRAYQAGETHSLREIALEDGISLDEQEDASGRPDEPRET